MLNQYLTIHDGIFIDGALYYKPQLKDFVSTVMQTPLADLDVFFDAREELVLSINAVSRIIHDLIASILM